MEGVRKVKAFPLKIVTPYGTAFDGTAQELVVRTLTGDVAILAGHINYLAPLGKGRAMVRAEGDIRYADCQGGMITVRDGNVTLLPITFTWKPNHPK